jgi:hypothetical protein
MLTKFKALPEESRIWIYQSNRPFTPNEVSHIEKTLAAFVEGWTAHEKKLAGSFEIRYNLFIIVGIDEKMAMASGCSIDKSVHIMRQLESDLGLVLLDRTIFSYKSGGVVCSVPRKVFEEKVAAGEIKDETIVFNNMVDRKANLATHWEIPMKNSWHAQLVR